MDSSPRPQRKFSHWQTRKRAFVLDGVTYDSNNAPVADEKGKTSGSFDEPNNTAPKKGRLSLKGRAAQGSDSVLDGQEAVSNSHSQPSTPHVVLKDVMVDLSTRFSMNEIKNGRIVLEENSTINMSQQNHSSNLATTGKDCVALSNSTDIADRTTTGVHILEDDMPSKPSCNNTVQNASKLSPLKNSFSKQALDTSRSGDSIISNGLRSTESVEDVTRGSSALVIISQNTGVEDEAGPSSVPTVAEGSPMSVVSEMEPSEAGDSSASGTDKENFERASRGKRDLSFASSSSRSSPVKRKQIREKAKRSLSTKKGIVTNTSLKSSTIKTPMRVNISNKSKALDESGHANRSLRDRSKLPTPESLQISRQYPVSMLAGKFKVQLEKTGKNYNNFNISSGGSVVSVGKTSQKKSRSGSRSPKDIPQGGGSKKLSVSKRKASDNNAVDVEGHNKLSKKKLSDNSAYQLDKSESKISLESSKSVQKSSEISVNSLSPSKKTSSSSHRKKRNKSSSKSLYQSGDQVSLNVSPPLSSIKQKKSSNKVQNQTAGETSQRTGSSHKNKSQRKESESSLSEKEARPGKLRDKSLLSTPESMLQQRQYPLEFYFNRPAANNGHNHSNKSQAHTSSSFLKNPATKKPSSQGHSKKSESINRKLSSGKGQKQRSSLALIKGKERSKDVLSLSRKKGGRVSLQYSDESDAECEAGGDEVNGNFTFSKDTPGYSKIATKTSKSSDQPLARDGLKPAAGKRAQQKNKKSLSENGQRNGQTQVKNSEQSLNETVRLSQGGPRRRNLVQQLNTVHEEMVSKGKPTNQSRDMMLWCGEDQTRTGADVVALDVILESLMAVEDRLRDEEDDPVADRIIYKVFKSIKNTLQPMISDIQAFKELEKKVLKQTKVCYKLRQEVAQKLEQEARMQRNLESLRGSQKEAFMQEWMKGFGELINTYVESTH